MSSRFPKDASCAAIAARRVSRAEASALGRDTPGPSLARQEQVRTSTAGQQHSDIVATGLLMPKRAVTAQQCKYCLFTPLVHNK